MHLAYPNKNFIFCLSEGDLIVGSNTLTIGKNTEISANGRGKWGIYHFKVLKVKIQRKRANCK